ncbi:MAG: hypothetical protein ABFD97_19790 [Syntrophobacter sp.]
MTATVKTKMGSESACSLSSPVNPGFGQGSFDEQARIGLEQYSQSFSKLIASKVEGKEYSEQEKQRRDRAKKANKIYKGVCEDIGLKACFFSNFGDWTEYVDGKMSDSEFRMNAELKARQMAAENN